MSSREIISEDQLRERLRGSGKTDEQIEQWINEYTGTTYEVTPDEQAISSILQKTQEDSILRVRSFRLTKEQYDALLSYFEESGELAVDQQMNADWLVKMAVREIAELILKAQGKWEEIKQKIMTMGY